MKQVGDNLFRDKDTDEQEKKVKEMENADKICYICCDKEPNTIYLPCGHGGSCKSCAY